MGNDGGQERTVDDGTGRGARAAAVAVIGSTVGLAVALSSLLLWFARDMSTFLTLVVIAVIGTPVAIVVLAACGAYAREHRVWLVATGVALVAAPIAGWAFTIAQS
ncbi:hypothetical protein [Curtobacterium sp. MCJR17_020]|uniref:hypothetical protein n=1 Tax=Curtobacterium sp. MCJR17_020 TaxID=2175619 RepID=UPI000DA7D472|nr:hypothetical protein [Curtobacterium sp. MCJR17_020]WIE72419.1 hypothetical protein DEJ14_001270 [Curtobacterium sp. MCJR17_020]